MATPRLPAEQLKQRLHDHLCQQLAGTALLQAALINRLEKAAGTDELLRQVVADARKVEELLRQALDEVRKVIREIE